MVFVRKPKWFVSLFNLKDTIQIQLYVCRQVDNKITEYYYEVNAKLSCVQCGGSMTAQGSDL